MQSHEGFRHPAGDDSSVMGENGAVTQTLQHGSFMVHDNDATIASSE